MNYIEEQKNELEALSEIYYNEIEVKSDKPPVSFSIEIRPQASYYEQPEMTGDDDDGDNDSDASEDELESVQCSSVKLLFELPSDYPEAKPSMRVLNSQNLEEDEVEQLLSNLSEKSEQSLGNVMIFELVSDVVEWLSSKAEREANAAAREQEKKIEALEAEERKKCDGTLVTRETFLAWKAKFDAELLREQLRLQQQMQQSEPSQTGQRRLTGREMFETDKALAESDLNFVDELEQEQLEALMQSINEAELEDDDDEDDDDDDDEVDLSDEDLSDEDLSDEDDSDDD